MSPVQVEALELFIVQEQKERAEDLVMQVKAALVSFNPEVYYPSLFPTATSVREEEINEDEDLSDTEGEWRFDEMDPAEAERVMQMMLAESAGGTLSEEDLENPWL